MRGTSRPLRQSTLQRRTAILDGALECFTRAGIAATTISDIQRASKASVGSIYHHFGSREELASQLYVEIWREYQGGLLARLARVRSAERGVRAMVEYHLDWVEKNPKRARFFFFAERPAVAAPSGQELAELNERFFGAACGYFEEQMDAQAIRRLPRDLFIALTLGPAQSYAKQWVDGRHQSAIARARRVLSDGAWAAVRGGG